MFPNVEAEAKAGGVSDHSPLVISIAENRRKGNRPFKFFNYWMKDHSFGSITSNSWNQACTGSAMFQVSAKLKMLKPELKELNKKWYSRLSLRVQAAKEELGQFQTSIQHGQVDNQSRMKEKDLLQKYVQLSMAEEEFYKQKSGVVWLKCGDKNTSFFHRRVKANNARNKVMSIIGMDGVRVEGEEAVHKPIFLNSWGRLLPLLVILRLLNMPHQLNDQQQRHMTRPVTEEEIKSAMFSIHSDKAPGPDGFSAGFSKNNWELVGRDII